MRRCTLLLAGAPLSARAEDVVTAIQTAGFTVDLVLTGAAQSWVRADELTAATSAELRIHSRPGRAARLPLPDLLVVCPATFNTINKAALGIADTPAHSFLCECIGARITTVLVPMVNDRLWNHPAFAGHLDRLVQAGAALVDVQTGTDRAKPVRSGTGDAVVETFDPAWITRRITQG